MYQTVMDYKRIYEDIMNSDPKIRLVTICDSNDKIMYSDHREGVQNCIVSSVLLFDISSLAGLSIELTI
jgi:hypothetical protein